MVVQHFVEHSTFGMKTLILLLIWPIGPLAVIVGRCLYVDYQHRRRMRESLGELNRR